jgi:polyhydroxyalkanoate synthesis regulator phasin
VNHTPIDQFLLLDDAAQILDVEAADLRRAIACGVVPIRRDNKGRIRVHRNEVPQNLHERLARADAVPELQVEAQADEIASLLEKLIESESYKARLENLLEQQSQALDRSSRLLDAHESAAATSTAVASVAATDVETNGEGSGAESVADLQEANSRLQKQQAEIGKLSELLSRAFKAIEQREQLIASETGQLTSTADKAMEMLDRAINDGEKSSFEASRLSALMEQAINSSGRLEKEIDQRNAMIDNQHNLMDRLVKLSERSVDTVQGSAEQQKPKRKLSFWQRLWRGRKGI